MNLEGVSIYKYVCWRSLISKNLLFFKLLNIIDEPYFTHLFLPVDAKVGKKIITKNADVKRHVLIYLCDLAQWIHKRRFTFP